MLKDFLRPENFGAQRAHLYVAGKFDAAACQEKAISDSFGAWSKGPAAHGKMFRY